MILRELTHLQVTTLSKIANRSGSVHNMGLHESGHGKVKIERHLQTEFKDGTLTMKCLVKEKDGNLWIGTADGLLKFKGKKGKPETVNGRWYSWHII